MIIDPHAHLWAGHYRPAWNQEAVLRAMANYRGISLEEAKEVDAGILDPSGDKIVAEMDAGGVDITVVVTIDYGMVLPGAENDSKVPLEEQFAQTAKATKQHPDRLIWGAGIDPRRANAAALVEKAVKEHGAKVIKLYPPNGFYPNDTIVYPMYKKAVELGVPVQFHVAPVPALPYLRSKYSHPIHIEDVAVDFPELKIEAVHSGGPWWHDMLAIAEGRPNIFLDVGNWQSEMRRYPLDCYRRVREMMDRVGPKRLMWASDWIGPALLPQASWLKAFQEMPDSVKEAGVDFTAEEMKAFLGETAAEFLGLSHK